MDTAILCAAVADFAPETIASQKIKRTGDDMLIRLKPNPDIAASLGQIKGKHQTLVGFALETHDEESHAQDKLKRKNFDFIVLNSLNDEGAGFRTDTNKISIISQNGKADFPLKTKQEVAKDIVDQLESLMLDN
jgi:phosphopantothenoylcysteine decarboxylase/phosphopantothenate--cysteine ligase